MVDSRDLNESLEQLRKDLNALVAEGPNVAVDAAAIDVIQAVACAAAALRPDHSVVAVIAEKLPFCRLGARDALVIVGHLLGAVPQPSPSFA